MYRVRMGLETTVRILRRPEVEKRTGLSRSAIYAAMKDDREFPAPVRIGKRAVGWRESAVERWIAGRKTSA